MSDYLEQVIQNFDRKRNDAFSRVVVDGETHEITWGQLEKDCHKLVANLQATVDKSGVVLIFLPHCVELFPCFLGCMLGGFTPSFMPCPSSKQDPELYWHSHQKLIDAISPVAIITNHYHAQQMKHAQLRLPSTELVLIEELDNIYAEFVLKSNDSIAFLQHSSGTTGLKKGVALSYDAIANHSASYGKSLELTAEDTIVSWLPLYHDMGLIACFITPIFHGNTTIQLGAFDWLGRPGKLFDLIKKHQGTLCWLPNFAFDHLSNTIGKFAKKYDLSSMRAFISCSEVSHSRTFDRFLEVFSSSNLSKVQIHNCYAMAETVFAVSQTDLTVEVPRIRVNKKALDEGKVALESDKGLSRELLSCGSIVDGLNIKIVDENHQPVNSNTVGEISISGDFLFTGYNKNPDRTTQVLKNGWYYTNDTGFMIDDQLFVLGRKDDLIIVNGRNLYAHQIEAIVSQIAGIKKGRCVAFGVYDEKVGSDSLVIVAELSADESKKFEITKNTIQNIQSEIDVVPAVVELKPQGTLIKTSSGKMSRNENKIRYLNNTLNPVLQEAV